MSVIPSPNPFIHGFLPRKDESLQERTLREQEEARAKAVSDAIDEQIKQDKAVFKRYQKAVKILLLGQSESGQSTNFLCSSTFSILILTRARTGKSTTIKSASFSRIDHYLFLTEDLDQISSSNMHTALGSVRGVRGRPLCECGSNFCAQF